MLAKMSRNIAIRTSNAESAIGFYRDVLGMKHVQEHDDGTELDAGQSTFFIMDQIDSGPPVAVHEFYVPNVEEAREQLLAQGCTVVKWEGAGRDCYMRDPFGLVFNLWESPASFERGEYDSTDSAPMVEQPSSDDRGDYVP